MMGYPLGRARENNLKYLLWKHGWVCIRPVGSAGGDPKAKVKPIDLVACKDNKILFIQVSKSEKGITKEEIDELVRLAEIAGAVPVHAYLNNRKWYFKELYKL